MHLKKVRPKNKSFFLDDGLKNISHILYKHSGKDVNKLSGSGAAGAIGAGLVALLNAKLVKGFESIAQLTNLEKKIKSADWVMIRRTITSR